MAPTDDNGAAAGESGESLRSVLVALAANTTIATAKGVAALMTGSSALFAETLHTVADAGNEVLLFVAIRRSGKPADDSHPLGYGAERWFWALLAAVGMFVVGGAVSVWEGVTSLLHPVELEAFWVGVTILVLSIVLDGISRVVAVRNLRAQAEGRGLTVREMLRETADPTLTTVYLEDTVDVAGAVIALVALVLHRVTGSAVPDAIATILIGALLGWVAYRLARRNRELLSNQAVPARYVDQLRDRLTAQPGLESVERLDAVYLGPGDVLVAADVVLSPGLSTADVAARIAAVRDAVHRDVPVVRRLSLTPVPGRQAPRGGIGPAGEPDPPRVSP